jgi:hypothetical protein
MSARRNLPDAKVPPNSLAAASKLIELAEISDVIFRRAQIFGHIMPVQDIFGFEPIQTQSLGELVMGQLALAVQ